MKTLFKATLTVATLIWSTAVSFSQINTTSGQTAQQLAEFLAGPNITVTNAVLSEGGNALGAAATSVGAGQFTGTNSDIGFDSGVILSSGNSANEAPGPNSAGNTGANLGNNGTAQMTAIAGVNTFDAITLEFDFEVQSSFIQFNYVFASEEYPEFAPPNNSGFNDVFAFFISGPGITGEENIALVPSSTNPVSINNINPVTNNQFYIDNAGGTDIAYDGYTTILEASRANLTACQIYHLKLVISDAGDGSYSSAVFLQENSLVQGLVEVQTQTVNADDIALEGCIEASFTFAFDDVSNQDRIINYYVGGTAVNGVDYQYIDSSLTIVAGDTSATIYIDAFSDGITEGQESVWIIYQPAACAAWDTAYLYINDAQPIDFTLDEFHLDCFEDNSGEIQVNATGGFPPYTFHVTHPDGSNTEETANPITGLSAGTYSVQVFDSYGCQADALVIGGVYDADTTFLPDGSGVTYDAPLDIQGFNTGQTITNTSQIQQICATMEHSYLGDLEITVESPTGQSIILKEQNGGGSCDLGEPIATGPVDGQAGSLLTDPGVGYEYCFNASPVFATMVDESNNFTRNYTDGMGNNYTDEYLPAGSYTSFEDFSGLVGSEMNGTWIVHVNDQWALDNGYIFNWYISLIGDLPDTLVTLIEPNEIVTTGFVTDATCGGSDGSINIDIQDAAAPYTVSWDSGQTTEDISGIPAGTYTVTVTDANGCQSQQTFLVNNIGSLSITSTTVPASCYGGNDGSIDITPAGGQAPYTFSWSSGPTSEDIATLIAGDYTVTMQDQMGCVISELVTVGQASQVVITGVSVLNEECNTDNGSIDIDVTGGTGSYGYQWSSGETTEDISNLTAATYDIDVIDGNGCTATNSFTIVNDVSNCSAFCFIDVQANALNDELCGSANGSIDINVLNALAPVSFSWSNGSTTEDITGLTAGDYTVVVTDANNCSDVATFTILNDAGNLTITSGAIGEENCGNSNGSIDITVTGGAMPYTFTWSNTATTEDLSGIGAGVYDILVTDGNGCQTSASYTVANNAGTLAATGTTSEELCTSANGSVNQTVTGGNGILTYSWDSGQTTEDISGLTAGDYTCTITDETGCYIVETYTVTQGTGDISLIGSNITHEVCGNGQGAVNITLTGQNLTFNWSNGATTEDITGVPAGDYTCTITNAQGCSYTTSVFSVINASGTLNVTTQLVTDEICGNGNGSINMNVTGGTLPYTYAWSNGATDEDIIGLSAGTYDITVTDANGCTESHSVIVNGNAGTLAIQNAVITDELCGDMAGAIDLMPTGGAAPLTYAWSNGPTSQDLTGLAAGVYDVTVSDNNGCTVNGSYTVSNLATGLAFTSAVTNEICSNGQGEITLNVTGGNAPYTFAWSNLGTTATINGLSSGLYSCTITDGSGCSIVTGDISVGNTASGMSASTVVTDASCSANGAVDLTVVGGSAPITFAWSNAETTEDITNLGAGAYDYTATDNNGCEVMGSATVIQVNGNITYTYTTASEVCGNGVGAIDLTPAGGTAPYTFVWSSGPTTEDLTGLSAGGYTCDITDNTGCTITTGTIQITNLPGNLSITNVVATDETCSNGLGSIDISVSGGAAPITFVWSNGPTTEDISNLSSGSYDVVVTDNNGCQATTQAVINSAAGSMSITQPIVTNENCSDGQGSIDITLAGASNPVTYVWSNGATSQDLTGLSAGAYNVTATDNNGCQVNGSYTITNNGSTLAIANASISDEYCGSASGTVSVTISGGTAPYTYAWSNGGTTSTIDNLAADAYSVTVTDASGCQVNGTYTVFNNPGNLALSGTVTDENCGDGTGAIDVVTTGGNLPLIYAWDSGQTTEDLSGLSAGVYNLTVTDNFGCSANYGGTVSNITGGLVVTITTVTDENCGQIDGAIDATITGTGIVSTVWSSGPTTEDISGLAAGSYTLTVTNDVGCTASATGTVVNQTAGLAITFSNIGDENCLNGQGFIDIEVSGTGPFTYLWSDSQTTQDAIGLTSGTYTVIITDGLGCELSQDFTVNNINNTNLSASSLITDAMCTSSNGEIDITTVGGISPFTYSWDTGDLTEDITGVAAGDYEITITDGANCQVTQIITVGSQSSGLAFVDLDITDEFCGACDGEVVFFTGGTADDYYIDGVNLGGWQGTDLCAGTYTASISDNLGCWADSIFVVESDAFFNVTGTSTDEFCGDASGTADITVTGGGGPGGGTYTYLWSNGEVTEDVSGLSAGTYTVTVTSDGGFTCSMDYTVTIANNSTFEITGVISDAYCGAPDGSIDQTIVSGTGLTFSWSNGPTTEDVTGLAPGTYTCTVTDPAPNGCVETFDYVVGSVSNGMTASAVITDEECNNGLGAIDLTMSAGSGTFTYVWSTTAVTEDISGLSAGNYDVTITDAGDGCTMTESYVVGNTNTLFGGSAIVIDAACATCADGSINVILSGATTYTYAWDNAEITEDIFGLNPGSYTVVVTSAEGCDTTMTFIVDNMASVSEEALLNMSMAIYPNPAANQFFVNFAIPEGEEGELIVTDAFGKLIQKVNVTGTNEISINSVDMESGMYFVTLSSRKLIKVERLVITKN
ncbi:MAG: choice-of-anchor L domain-containing protein [Crocinitomicaceae bacterium]|nr:choice-of-anchor L domain-containing protein [Crocinitomicaceae bacterium]